MKSDIPPEVSFGEVLAHLRSLNLSDEMLMIKAASLIAEAKHEARFATWEAADAKEALRSANAFIEELGAEVINHNEIARELAKEALQLILNEMDALYKRAKSENHTAATSKGGRRRAANDPIAVTKRDVRRCWVEWKKRPDLYKSTAGFSRAMVDRFLKLSSDRVVAKWCRDWEKEVEMVNFIDHACEEWKANPSLHASERDFVKFLMHKNRYFRDHGLSPAHEWLQELIDNRLSEPT